ncbi:hypothetical protein BKA69DRAFT_799348 [Paraphysoderma sedebokerense]|nr:hypothetical protein BKA69DRAFT_799348 [Paraphysoderma sedebokerense]
MSMKLALISTLVAIASISPASALPATPCETTNVEQPKPNAVTEYTANVAPAEKKEDPAPAAEQQYTAAQEQEYPEQKEVEEDCEEEEAEEPDCEEEEAVEEPDCEEEIPPAAESKYEAPQAQDEPCTTSTVAAETPLGYGPDVPASATEAAAGNQAAPTQQLDGPPYNDQQQQQSDQQSAAFTNRFSLVSAVGGIVLAGAILI